MGKSTKLHKRRETSSDRSFNSSTSTKSSSAQIVARKVPPRLLPRTPKREHSALTVRATSHSHNTRLAKIRQLEKVYWSKRRQQIVARVTLSDATSVRVLFTSLKRERPELFIEFLHKEVQEAMVDTDMMLMEAQQSEKKK